MDGDSVSWLDGLEQAMRSLVALALVALLLGFPSVALALREESFGNEPMAAVPGWPQGLLEVVNLRSRVYFLGGDGPNICYFRGTAKDLQRALEKFARIKEGKCPLFLVPGPAQTHSFDGRSIVFNWQVHLGIGAYRATSMKHLPVLRVYVDVPAPRPLTVDSQIVQRWLAELDSDSFLTRDRARQQLARLGNDAKPLYRAALKGQISLEKRRRLEGLLNALPAGYDVSDFEVPAGMTFLTVDDLLAQNLKKLLDPNTFEEGTLEELAGLEPHSDKVVPGLTSFLDRGKGQWLRCGAALALAEVGFRARAALPVLKEGRNDPDPSIRKHFQMAIDKLQQCREGPAQLARLQKLAIAQDLRELKKRRESALK
jgi:hypothetical protein